MKQVVEGTVVSGGAGRVPVAIVIDRGTRIKYGLETQSTEFFDLVGELLQYEGEEVRVTIEVEP